MTKTFRALGVAASLVMGTALAASAATTNDNMGNTAPTTTPVQPMSPGYQGGTTTAPGYQTSQTSVNGTAATTTPQVDRGNAEGAAGGAGGGGGAGAGGGGGSGR